MLLTSFFGTGVGNRWRGAQRSDKEHARVHIIVRTSQKNLASCRERNATFRGMPGIREQAVSLNAPRGRVHRSVLSIP
jgi:hypothetical protein